MKRRGSPHGCVMNFWSPLADPHHSRHGTRPERYALRVAEAGPFLAISGRDQQIAEVPSAERAFLFHTHQGALRVARELTHLAGRSLNVVKVL